MKNDVAGYLSSQLAFLENIHKPLKDSVVFNCFGNDRICSTGYFLHFFNRLKIIKIVYETAGWKIGNEMRMHIVYADRNIKINNQSQGHKNGGRL